MRSRSIRRVVVLLAGALVSAASVGAQPRTALTLDRLTAQPSLSGTAPISPAWSSDGMQLAFAWNDGGMPLRDVWVVAATGGTPRRVTDMARAFPYPEPSATDPDTQLAERVAARARGGVSGVTWVPNRAEIVFAYRGDLFRVAADGSGLTRLTQTPAGRGELAFSPDGAFLSWLQEGDLWLWNQKTNESARATRIGMPPLSTIAGARYTRPDVEVSAYGWSPDSRQVMVQVDDRSQVRKIALANFLAPDTEVKYVRRDYPGDHDWVRAVGLVAIADGRLRMIDLPDKTDRRIGNVAWSPDSTRLLVDQHSENAVHRWMYVVSAADATPREVWHDERETRTTQFWNSAWRGDGQAIVFISDVDDRHHLYSLPAAGGKATRLTSGDWSVISQGFGGASLDVSPNTREVLFVAAKKNPSERHVYRMADTGGPVTQVTTIAGVHQPLVSPDGARVALLHSSDVTPPELYVVEAKGGAAERRLTTSPPKEFASYPWVQPRYVTFKSHTDGVTLHGRLLEPPGLDKTKKYPVILGPVYAFTVRNQWRGTYSLLEQFLAQEGGYIGLQVDVRGSSGYGREFREKLLRDYGGIDVEDLQSGAEYLKTLPYVDGDRIGIWGWSYGGLLTTMSLFKKPGFYKAGVAGAPATNVWHATTGEVHVTRLPDTNPDVFRSNSAYNFADGLQDHLMLIHGVVDDIVLFRDSAALAEKLMMLDKNFDFVILPSSPHAAIQKDYVARFILRKITEHFDRYLGKRAATGERNVERSVIRPLRWYIVGLLFLSTVISYVDRQVLSVNAPLIRAEYHLSNTQYSQLVTAFLIGFTIGQPLMGWVIDRRGTRFGLLLAMLWWSTAGMLHGVARGFGDFAACRFLLGIGEGGAVPGSMRGISEWFPQRERSFATGLFASGTTVGALVSGPVIAFTTLSYGWRMAFVVTGASGLVWLAAWLWLYDLPERHPRIDPEERRMIVEGRPRPSGRTRAWTFELLRHRKPWGIIAGRSIMDPVWWFYVFWLPSYLTDVRGFDLAAIGLFAWIPFLAAAGGTFTGGWWSGRLLQRTTLTRARKTVLLAGAAGTLLGMPAARAPDAWLCLLLISAVTFSIGMWATITLTLAVDILPPDAVGSMTGLAGGGAAFVGIGFTLLIGWIVDRFSYWPVFVIAGTAPLVGFAVLSTLVGEIRPLDPVHDRLETGRA